MKLLARDLAATGRLRSALSESKTADIILEHELAGVRGRTPQSTHM
jgi:hypothetical protein